jgi:ATP-binding cassette, subfamily B, bacterial
MSQQFQEKEYNTDTLDTSLWKRIFALIWEQKSSLYLLFALVVVLAVIDVTLPYLHKVAIDDFVSGQQDSAQLMSFGLLYLALIVTQSLVVYFFIYQAGKVEMNFAYTVRQKGFERLQNLSFSYYDKTPLGWIMARMTSDISRLAEIISWSLIDLFWGSALIIGITVVMLWVNWQLALLVLVTLPILAYISVNFQQKILRKYREVRKINSQITGAFSEGITGAKTAKTLVMEKYQNDEFQTLTKSMRQESIKAAIMSALFMPIVMGLGALSTALIIWLGGEAVLKSAIPFGTLVLFVSYAGQFFEPLRQMARLLAEFQMAQANAERILSLIEEPLQIVDTAEVIEKYGTLLNPKIEQYEKMKGDVEFKDVHFFYKPEEVIFDHFNLKVKAGTSIALVGETGSGKSSLVNLVSRFYEVKAGELLIDGVNIQARSLGWLHSNLGYVLQSPHLFSGTVMENIRYGRLQASDEEVMAAAKQVKADAFILQLEDGYQSEVGEGGGKLSTGQKQLISFARAILANPSLFILDEATSSIDTETEAAIQSAIDVLMRNRTSFVVAHRLSTIVKSDRILVLKDGKIVEDGNHIELMALKGYYHRLYTHQFNQEQQAHLLHLRGQDEN